MKKTRLNRRGKAVALSAVFGLGLFCGATCERVSTAAQAEEIARQESEKAVFAQEIANVEENRGEYTSARISHYCNCAECCGKWYTQDAIGAAGIPLRQGVHCAATKDVPLGAEVEVNGQTYIVADRVSNWIYDEHGTTIDIFCGNDHAGALEKGVYQCDVLINY